MKGFKITAFQGFPVLKISIPDPWISSPTPMTAFGLCTLLTGQFHKNLFFCCKVSLGNLCLTVQFLLPTSTKWARRAACGTMLKTMSQEHLGKKEPSGGCECFFGREFGYLRVNFNRVYLAGFQNHPHLKNQAL